MKSKLMLSVLAGMMCLLFAAGSAMAQGGELVSAEWGVRGRRVDVTSRVSGLMRNGGLNFQVTRFVLGTDPDPHQVKDLLIRVRRWDGQIEDFDYFERGVVNLELDPEGGYEVDRKHSRDDDDRYREHDRDDDRFRDRDDRYRDDDRDRNRGWHGRQLRILRAYYGAEGQFINVTDNVQSQLVDGRIYLRVNNATMGGDPLPAHRKWLRVLYAVGGERRSVFIEEKTELQLP
jgi:hypothetical protein